MKDMVTNGTGNSRFLKTSLASGTTWETALAQLRAGTFPVDFNGLNTGGITQQGSAYSKANVLPDDVCSLLGLDSTTAEPKDAFEVVGNPAELWVWEKKNASTRAHIGYVVSPSSTTYPEDGQQGDYWYTRLGQIGDGMTRIETGSYVGTGTYGASNPNSLNVPFTPKLMFLAETTKGITVIAVNGMSSALEYGSTNTPEYSLIFTSWGTTVSWYSSSSAAQQGNQNNRTYTYVFIG